MSDAPERIWAARGLYDFAPGQRYPNTVEYIRADLARALIDTTAERDALRAALEWAWSGDGLDECALLIQRTMNPFAAPQKPDHAVQVGLRIVIDTIRKRAALQEDTPMSDTTDKTLDALQERLKAHDSHPESASAQADAAIAALRAELATARADAVRVKPLVWEDMGGYWRAKSCVGEYEAGWEDGAWAANDGPSMWEWRPEEDPRRLSEDNAKAAAQADYEARIVAALEPTPSAPSPEAVARATWERAIAAAKANGASEGVIEALRKNMENPVIAACVMQRASAAKAGGGE